MADDIFGDESLFSEFEKDRGKQNIFINFDEDESGAENRSRIVFKNAESDEDFSDDENDPENAAGPKQVTQTTGDSQTSAEELRKDPASEDEEMVPGFHEKDGTDDRQTTSYQERFERNKYRKFSRLIDSTRYVPDEQSPAVQIIFQNNKFARKYRARIEQFLISLTEHADKKDFCRHPSDLSMRVAQTSCTDINDKLPVGKRSNQMWQTHAIVGCAQFHAGFMVDAQGGPREAQEPEQLSNFDVPKYFQVYDEIFPPDDDKVDASKPPAPPKDSCFNCGGEHKLSECKAARDHARIFKKRQEHQEKQMSSRKKTSFSGRYHKDPELDPNKKKFKAGEISTQLREAMGLKPEQLPSYIYRMRLFGYPPGWLQEASRSGPSLAMYDKDGNETNMRGESLEDGEVGADNSTDPAGSEAFDLEKIIEYPGFTVPVPLGFVDESATLDLPPIQQHQLKRTLAEDIAVKDQDKKRKLEEEEAVGTKRAKESTEQLEDMELEDEDEVPAPKVTSTPTSDKEAAGEPNTPPSPTMDALLQQQQKLVGELGAVNGASEDSSGAPTGAAQSSLAETSAPVSDSQDMSEADYLREKNFSFTSTLSVSKDYGTPILVREKSYKSLPSDEKFSQGIEDHIPFENLPDSTGTFNRMKNLFKIIKEKVKGTKKK